MLIDLTPDQKRLRDELREYFRSCLTAEGRARISADPFGHAYMEHCRALGRDGKLGLGWPKEYGGGGYGPLEQQIFANEIARAEVPYPIITVQTVGPTLMQYGTAAQKEFFLPRILAGECHFAIGYSEPGRAPTWPPYAPPRSATATTTSSTGRRSSLRAATTPTTSGSPPAPTRTRRSTAGSR